ncbi:tryptophan synthase subunit alpha [Desulfurobacterium indicum]|uniref:Tryptophan synthase alpha chain n=1 Tax=Desulfurobacterium indicum TaxID=1914305 RepID=A0A1R1MLI3_9BACT|nr:tryptophan synthase subunit alpha [Desulfurobacterium indicum]OMH40668.1 tryptophan synthase subunit alpha [Desulfurobacterium indicum]
MGRIEKAFEEKKPLIIYATACDPDFNTSLEFFRIILKYADIVEVGMPFSDPLADGPTIQKAHERALKSGANTRKVLELVSVLRKEFPDKGILLMGYYNPIFVYGEEKFVEDAFHAGSDGFIVPDLPPEEGKSFSDLAKSKGLSPIFLAAPTSTDERLKLIAEVTGDFIYYVSLTGTTGAREELDFDAINEDIRRVKTVTGRKVVVGFGISKKRHIINLYEAADGFVVGSAVVKNIEAMDKFGLEELLKELKMV